MARRHTHNATMVRVLVLTMFLTASLGAAFEPGDMVYALVEMGTSSHSVAQRRTASHSRGPDALTTPHTYTPRAQPLFTEGFWKWGRRER